MLQHPAESLLSHGQQFQMWMWPAAGTWRAQQTVKTSHLVNILIDRHRRIVTDTLAAGLLTHQKNQKEKH